MLSIAKFGAKLGIVGAAVWVTVDNSIWDKSEYANKAINKVKQSLPEATELLKDLPNQKTIADKWNQSVSCAFKTIGNSSEIVKDSIHKLSDSLTSQKGSPKDATK